MTLDVRDGMDSENPSIVFLSIYLRKCHSGIWGTSGYI